MRLRGEPTTFEYPGDGKVLAGHHNGAGTLHVVRDWLFMNESGWRAPISAIAPRAWDLVDLPGMLGRLLTWVSIVPSPADARAYVLAFFPSPGDDVTLAGLGGHL